LIRDNNGRITDKTETVAGTLFGYVYTYDAMGRLWTVTKDSNLVEEYQYDLNGTRTYEMNTLRGIAGRTYSYSDEDHLLSAGSVTYVYDIDGFLTTKTDGSDVKNYSYSSRGELLSVTQPEGRVVEYIHDPLGRRIAKKVNGSIVEKYLWQGLTRLLAVYDASDALLTRFEYADGRMPVAMTSGGNAYYLAYDQVGSLKLVADSAGNVIKLVQYDSLGNIINDSNPSFVVPFGFAGGLHDRDTDLLRFGYRDYDPDVGRWTAKDPIFFDGGDTDLYGYVLNNPVNLIDPSGLEFSDILPGIKKAIVEGTKGGAYAVGEAAKATADIAMHGHPLAQVAIGVAVVSEIAPLSGAAVISVLPTATSVIIISAPHSPVISDFTQGFFIQSPPPPSPAGYAGMSARQFIVDPLLDAIQDEPLKNNCE